MALLSTTTDLDLDLDLHQPTFIKMEDPVVKRLEVLSLTLIHNEDNPIFDMKDSSIVLVSDGLRVREIYNPVKLKDFYTDLPQHILHSYGFQKCPKRIRSGDDTDLAQYEEILHNFAMLPELIRGAQDDSGGSRRTSKRKWIDFISEPTDFPLTGPHGEFTPDSCFDIIVHQEHSGDDSYLEEATPRYIRGHRAYPSDKVVTCTPFDSFCDRPLHFYCYGAFGSLRLDCILFRDSKLLTVSVEWLIEQGIATETYVSGELFLYSGPYKVRSVLLQTPEGKAIKVVQGKPIPLLRSLVAVPYRSSFTVEASLGDPIHNFRVKGSAFFNCVDFPKENVQYIAEQLIYGNDAKIKVKVVMEPNYPSTSPLW